MVRDYSSAAFLQLLFFFAGVAVMTHYYGFLQFLCGIVFLLVFAFFTALLLLLLRCVVTSAPASTHLLN